ncbi:unnamed protein product [Bursaphelenchus okinawaensis]|uniref:Uncharacterized protein n=1 Tax=Bursaphelenchus okinawaensis TaxID=465554 RepID=A0A811JUD2_9BILA|nr:unnamed protein product [Bursaphelenchus okinawaensis]CAG9083649.1 unnamed protein product [Bursaphelenchus okinawaensis]
MAKTATTVEEIVQEPSTCTMYDDFEEGTDMCELYSGCFMEYYITRAQNYQNGGCVQGALDESTEKFYSNVNSGIVCGISSSYRSRRYIYYGQYVIVNNGVDGVDGGVPVKVIQDAKPTDRLRWTKVVNCCEKSQDCALPSQIFYFHDFTDERKEFFDNQLQRFGLMK